MYYFKKYKLKITKAKYRLYIFLAFIVTEIFWRIFCEFFMVYFKIFLALIIGGALGNLYDRIFLGVVRDFIGIGPWPNFNLADAAIVVGVLLFALYSYQPSHE